MSTHLKARCSLFTRRLNNKRKAAGVTPPASDLPQGADAKSHLCHFFKDIHPEHTLSHMHGDGGKQRSWIRQRKHSGGGPSGKNTTKPPRCNW